ANRLAPCLRRVVVVAARVDQQVATEGTHVPNLGCRHEATGLREGPMGAGQCRMVSDLIQGRPGTNRHARGRVPIDPTAFLQSSEADQGADAELASLQT